MAARLKWTLFVILFVKVTCTIAQAPQLTPSGSMHSCENDALTFSCSTSGASLWQLTGFNGVTSTPTFARDLSASSRISTSDVNRASNPSNIIIMNLSTDDTGGTVQCEDVFSQVRSSVSTITVGPPICDINITIEDIAVDSVAVSWVVTSCTAQPTEYEVVWSEVGSEVQSGTSGRISSNSYTVDNLTYCGNYTITVLLYNECGVGSNSSTCACTNVGSLNITEAGFCSLFPVGLHVDVIGGHIRCPVKGLVFSVNGTDFTYPYNSDPTTVYDIMNGSAGEVYYYTVTAIYTETVTVSSDTASVTVKQGFKDLIPTPRETSIEFQCINSCQRPLSSSYSCKITLDNGATAQGKFVGNSAVVTINKLSSGTTYYYNASVIFNNVAVDVIDDDSVTTLEISCPRHSLTDVAKIAIAVTVSLVLSVISTAVITIMLTYFCCVKKKNAKRSTQDIDAEYEVVEKSKTNKQSEDVQLQQSPAYGVLNTEN